MSDTKPEPTETEWALLRVAVAVFDTYAHGAQVPSLARETANVIERALQFNARNVRNSGVGMLLSRAGAELHGMAYSDPFAVRAAGETRDYFTRYIEGKKP